MPYVKQNHRKKIDPFLGAISEEIARGSTEFVKPEEIGQKYYQIFLEIATSIKELELGQLSDSVHPTTAQLVKAIFEAGIEEGGSWAGDLNYALTRVIQIVPRLLVEKQMWSREFRYWVYAATAGALERTALAINGGRVSDPSKEGWICTMLVGVLLDVKDEYKRRVNAPYEEVQIKANGDCYDVKL